LIAIHNGHIKRRDIIREAEIEDKTFQVWMPSLIHHNIIVKKKVNYSLGSCKLDSITADYDAAPIVLITADPDDLDVYPLDEEEINKARERNKMKNRGKSCKK